MWWHVYFIQSLIKLWRLLSWNLFCFYFHQKTCHCSIFSFISPVCEHPCIACRLHTVLSKIEKKSQRVGRLVWLFYLGRVRKKKLSQKKITMPEWKAKVFYTTPTYLLPKQIVTEQSMQHTNKWKIKFKLINIITYSCSNLYNIYIK